MFFTIVPCSSSVFYNSDFPKKSDNVAGIIGSRDGGLVPGVVILNAGALARVFSTTAIYLFPICLVWSLKDKEADNDALDAQLEEQGANFAKDQGPTQGSTQGL